MKKGSGKLILQDIRSEKREAGHGFEIRQGAMIVALRHHGNMLLVLSVLLLVHLLLPRVVVDSAAGDYTWVKVFWHVTPCRLGNS